MTLQRPGIGEVVIYKQPEPTEGTPAEAPAMVLRVRDNGPNDTEVLDLLVFGVYGSPFHRYTVSQGDDPDQWSWGPVKP
jgi:hypothetical protein